MLTADDFRRVRAALGQQAEEDIAWAEGCKPPETPEDFAWEAIFVICNSGMKNTVARNIFGRCRYAILMGHPIREVFGHPGKADAIQRIWDGRAISWQNYLDAKPEHKLEYLAGLPWIGDITKYHLAKNFGLPYAKPDVHLQRLADREAARRSSCASASPARRGSA